LYAPRLAKDAQTNFLNGFKYMFNTRVFEIKTEWVHGEALVASFPKKVQPDLKGKLGE
jgi:hypothetical protein